MLSVIKYLSYLVLVLLLIPQNLSAQELDLATEEIETDSAPDSLGMLLRHKDSEALMLQVRSSLFNFRMDEAMIYADSLSKTPDGLAAALYHESWTGFLWAMFEQTDSLAADFIKKSDQALKSKSFDEDEDWGRLLKAELKLQQAFVHARLGRNLKAAMAARKAYKYYEENIDKNPLHWDSYKGLGILQIMIGSIPSSYRKVLSVMGYSGSVEDGLRSLSLASEKGSYFSDEAKLYLAIADITVNQSKLGGDQIIRDIYQDSEPTPFVSLIQVYALQSSRNAMKVIEVCESLLSLDDKNEYYLPPFVDFYMGDALFKLNRFEDSIPHFKKFVGRFEGRSLRAPALTKLALSYDILGDRQSAVSTYKKVAGESEYDVDVFARRTASKYLNEPPSTLDIEVLKATNLHDAGRPNEARTIFLELYESQSQRLNLAHLSYMIGRSYHHEGALADALEWYDRAMKEPFNKEERWIPWSAFYLGEVHEEMVEYDKAVEFYEKAISYKGNYDYKRSLEQKTKAALSRVKSLARI